MVEARSDAPFTVKWEVEHDGLLKHKILDADQINVAFNNTWPKEELKLGIYSVPSAGIVVVGNPHEGTESMCLAHGMVYVMNRDGKTVAKYKLADPNAKQGEQVGATPRGAQGSD